MAAKSMAHALKDRPAYYQIPVPRDIMEFQTGPAIREAGDLDFVPKELLDKRKK